MRALKQKLEKPFGYEVTVEFNEGPCRRSTKMIPMMGTAANARQRAMYLKRALRIMKMEPLDEVTFLRAYGDPRIRNRFS